MDIIQFIEDPNLIGDKILSPAQRMGLKSVYGLPLSAEETDLFRRTTGLSVYPAREFSEVTFLLGRRSGKSSKLAAHLALYEACCRDHKLAPGEMGIVMIVSSELKRQSRIVFEYCLGKLERSPLLRKLIRKTTADEIALTNGVLIQVYPCNVARIRGASLIAFIGDECAFWRVEGKSVDKEVLDSARPGLQFPYSKMVKISTPWMMRGEIYNDWKYFFGKEDSPVLVFQGSTELFNPSFSKSKLAAAKQRDAQAYEQEFGAQFRSDLSSLLDPFVIDRAVNYDRSLELPYREKAAPYCAFVDCAGGGGRDSYAMGIGHREGEKIVIDVIRARAPKFNPEEVTENYCSLLKAYNVFRVTGDRFSGDWSSSAFNKFGIRYEPAAKNKSELYLEAEGLFNAGRIELPNHELAINQFKNLIRKSHSGGRSSVDTDGNLPEDAANTVAGCASLLAGNIIERHIYWL